MTIATNASTSTTAPPTERVMGRSETESTHSSTSDSAQRFPATQRPKRACRHARRVDRILDQIGSGAETLPHLRQNGRICVMLCAL